ncbi:MAG: HlyC/CorC family transporter [Verrucomicrobiae bacterium]|nr:HlyC/CorC family transporter [Verrucomicrobiae bacterium]
MANDQPTTRLDANTSPAISVPAPDESKSAPQSSLQPAFQPASQGWLSAIRQRLGCPAHRRLRDTIEGALRQEAASQSAFSAEERQMMLRMLRFGAKRVVDIMVPRADIIALDESEPLSELLRTFEDAAISRIPIFKETLDDPRGMVHIKDLLPWIVEAGVTEGVRSRKERDAANAATQTTDDADEPPHAPDASGSLELSNVDLTQPISALKIKRPVLYVPPSMPAMNLLIRMQATRNHMALVVDEYGGTDGLVTIEDLVEQIVGDIEDEYDDDEHHISRDAAGTLSASARATIAELEELLGRRIVSEDEAEEADTLGGLVFHILGRVPTRGEIVHHPHSGLELEVLDADARRIKRLRIDPSRLVPLTGTDATATPRG